MRSQQAVEPWAQRNAELEALDQISQLIKSVKFTGRLLSVVVLLRQHLRGKEIARMLLAFASSSSCRPLLTTFKYLPRLVCKSPPQIHGCALHTKMCLGPHCQCKSVSAQLRERHELPENRCAEVQLPCKKGKGARRGKRKAYQVPLWVKWCTGEDLLVEKDDFTGYCAPRYQVCAAGPALGIEGMFRFMDPELSRCQVPLKVYVQHDEVQKALCSGIGFLTGLLDHVTESLGVRGVNADVLDFFKTCSVAWDWSTLLFDRPEQKHADAFMKLLEMLKPRLTTCYWPSESRAWNMSTCLCRKLRGFPVFGLYVLKTCFWACGNLTRPGKSGPR